MSVVAVLYLRGWDGRETRQELGTFEDKRALQRGIAGKYYELQAQLASERAPFVSFRIETE
jgi:hypothetical protein